jgi:dTMP kinase
MARGIFITFEGSEGCGKSTQTRRLHSALESGGKQVVMVREPGSTSIGEEIRHLLQFSKSGEAMAPETELLLFTASRAQLVREVLLPALEQGMIVVADRFHDSTTVYQGVARRIDRDTVAMINRFAVGNCLPDITFVLDLDPVLARERLGGRPSAGDDRMERQPEAFYTAVREGYLRLAEAEPARVQLIDASRDEASIASEIREFLKRRFDGIL